MLVNLCFFVSVAKADHSSHDCFGCAISSHGSEGDKIWATDEEVEISEITELFNAENCASLQLKPKLFFIAVSSLLFTIKAYSKRFRFIAAFVQPHLRKNTVIPAKQPPTRKCDHSASQPL